MKKSLIVVSVVVVIAVTALFGWFYYQNSLFNSKLVEISKVKFADNVFSYRLQTKNRTNSDIDLTITEIPYSKQSVSRPIYFYYDTKYPFIGTTIGNAFGIYNHLMAEFQQKHISQQINIVDSSQLPDILKQKDNIVIMANGVLPDTVYTRDINLVTPWLKNGGTMVWTGDGLGYYFGTKDGKITSADGSTSIGWSGQRELLGQNYLEGGYIPKVEDSLGDSPSFLANALGIRSRFTQTGTFVSALILGQGLDLGYNYNFETESRTSLSAIKVGQGTVYLFGSVVLNRETDIGWDISQLIISDVANANTSKITSRKVTVKSGAAEQIPHQVNVTDDDRVKVIVFTPSSISKYFYSQEFNHD